MWSGSRSCFPSRTGFQPTSQGEARFWTAALLLFALIVYAGVKWIPPRPPSLPQPVSVEVLAPVLPVTFVEEGPLDLNRATALELQELPGIGPVLAERIVAFRERQGPFLSVEDLLQVPGIGEKTLELFRDLVTVEGPK